MSIQFILLSVLVLILLPVGNAHAYIDPGTGSFIIQMLIASILGAVLTVKMWIGTIKRFFLRLVGRGPSEDSANLSKETNLTEEQESSNA